MRKIIFLLLFSLSPLLALAGVVKGTIRDTTGEPVPYVIVAVKNSAYGCNSNLQGGYFLELKAGTYTLTYSQLGFATQEHVVTISDEKVVVLDVVMHTSAKMLGTYEVVAKGDRDRGKEIMKQVIDHRGDYWDKVQNYQCSTYEKSSLEKVLIEKPGDTLVPRAKPVVDTTSKKGKKKDNLDEAIKDQHLNLIEYVSQTYFRAPGSFKENILAFHDFVATKPVTRGVSETMEYGEHEIAPVEQQTENPYLLLTDAQSIDFNFYKNTIEAPALCSRPLLSPFASTAFLNYKFELLDSFPENGKVIYKLSVIPIFNEDALFSGNVFVEKDSWAIVSVNLCINQGVLLYCKEFCVVEDYSQVDTGIYLPTRREFTYTIKDGKYNILGNTRVDHSDYVVNGEIPKNTFTDEVKHFNDDAFDKDSAYWVEHRTIRLEEKEISYIHLADSLTEYYQSPEYFAKIDSSFNHINGWSFLLNGVGHRNRTKGNEFFFDPLIADCVPFGVGGYRQKIGAYYNHDFPNGMLLETEEMVDYGFLNRDVRGKAGVGLTYFPKKFVRTFIRVGDYYDMINNYASLESVFSRSNYVRTQEFSIAQRMEIVNGLFGELTFEFKDQSPITGMQLEHWSDVLFGALNAPTAFDEYIKSEFRLELKYRFRQKYMIKKNKKIILGSKYPEVRCLYRKGVPGLFNSEVNFDYIEFSSLDEFKFGRWGTSNWQVLMGAFINKKDLRLLEYKYFRGSDSFIFSDPIRSFQLLGPTLTTPNAFFRLNYIHHFEGAFGSKIPLFNKLKITMSVGGGVLMIPSQNFHHEEFFLGLEHVVRIRKQLFRVGIFGVTADNNLTKATITYKIGLSYYNSATRKWSY